jgi:hypothetical protein
MECLQDIDKNLLCGVSTIQKMEFWVKGVLGENLGLVGGTFSPGFRGIFAVEVDS